MSSQQPTLDEAKIREFLIILAAGFSRASAARYIDCPIEHIDHLARITPEFENAMCRAEMDFELPLVASIMQAAQKSPQSAKWLLERMRPEDFGRRPASGSRRGHAAQTAPDVLPASPDPSTPLAGRASDENPRDDDAPTVSSRGDAVPEVSRRGHAAPSAPLAGRASDENPRDDVPAAVSRPGQAAPVAAPPAAGPSTAPRALHPNRRADAPRPPDTSVPRSPAAVPSRLADASAPRGPRTQRVAGRAPVPLLLALLLAATTLACLGLVVGRWKLDVDWPTLVRPVQTSTAPTATPTEFLDTWTILPRSPNTWTIPPRLGSSPHLDNSGILGRYPKSRSSPLHLADTRRRPQPWPSVAAILVATTYDRMPQ